jgi:trehalose/maltose hydrolase-like predicted phosphorylase
MQVEVMTSQTGIRIMQQARLELQRNGESIKPVWQGSTAPGVAEMLTEIRNIAKGDRIVLEKVVYIDFTDDLIGYMVDTSGLLKKLPDFGALHKASAGAWSGLWKKADIQIDGDRLAQRLLRMHIYHLLCTTSPHNVAIDFGIPARGLTGEAYRGHIFWDEMYILPFYFIHFPEVARAVLMYRYRRLDAARAYARQHGYRGAMFPWQSGSTGEEETQQFHYNPVSGKWGDDNSSLQRHVSLAIAWNIIQYHDHTLDERFLIDYGLEILLEISRFWRSKCALNEQTGRYSIDKVMGPDEFHEGYPGAENGGLRDNAYTNVMVAWLFGKVEKLLLCCPEGDISVLLARIGFSKAEIDEWQTVAQKLNLVISPDGIIAQFDGYFDLKELDFDAYRKKYGDIYRMDRLLKAEGKTPDEYKVAKQADTLMLFYVLKPAEVTALIGNMGYDLPEDYLARNLAYYIARTSHGSTLSRVVHAWLAGLTGDNEMAWTLFRGALLSDYSDIQGGTTAEGIHTGVMAGTVLVAMTLYGGLEPGLAQAKPLIGLPNTWNSIRYQYTYRGQRHQIEIKR